MTLGELRDQIDTIIRAQPAAQLAPVSIAIEAYPEARLPKRVAQRISGVRMERATAIIDAH